MCIDQFDRGEEADPLSKMLDGLDTERRGDVGLSGAGTTDQHDIVGAVDKLAAMELADQRLVDFAAGKVEARQIPIGGKPGCLELIGNGAHLSFGRFRSEEQTSELQSLM